MAAVNWRLYPEFQLPYKYDPTSGRVTIYVPAAVWLNDPDAVGWIWVSLKREDY